MKDQTPAGALAALEALFAPKKPEAAETKPARASVKMVTAKSVDQDPRAAERSKLLGRLLAAEGRASVTRCANELLNAGLAFGEDQDVQLALLQHCDEGHVRDALGVLARLLDEHPAKRKTVLEARLRWLEEEAEEEVTREMAAALRRRVLGAGRGRTT